MTPSTIPTLPRGVRTHFDKVRGVTVLLGPERVLMLDAIADAVLKEVDGKRSIAEISAALAVKYNTLQEEILSDVIEYLDDLAAKRLLDVIDD